MRKRTAVPSKEERDSYVCPEPVEKTSERSGSYHVSSPGRKEVDAQSKAAQGGQNRQGRSERALRDLTEVCCECVVDLTVQSRRKKGC